jgi:hypothetical protein
LAQILVQVTLVTLVTSAGWHKAGIWGVEWRSRQKWAGLKCQKWDFFLKVQYTLM